MRSAPRHAKPPHEPDTPPRNHSTALTQRDGQLWSKYDQLPVIAPAAIRPDHPQRRPHRISQTQRDCEISGLGVRRRTYVAALAVAELPFAVGAVMLGEGVVNRHIGWLVAFGVVGAGLSLCALWVLHKRLDQAS